MLYTRGKKYGGNYHHIIYNTGKVLHARINFQIDHYPRNEWNIMGSYIRDTFIGSSCVDLQSYIVGKSTFPIHFLS